MRKGGGHSKGAEFERKIAKMIVKAFKHKKIKQAECWRSVMSGGHEISSGDIRMSRRLEKLFPFSVECKFRKKIRWENLFMRKDTEESSWLDQAEEGAAKGKNLTPVVVAKANHCEILALYRVYDTAGVFPIYYDRKHRAWAMVRWSKFLKNKARAANGKRT